MGKMQAVK